ncbi:helicase HerA-like domain-containing protein [Helcococcus bovis]|uniref:helicase HerA-like domain-containing protein n=1 Tax=Helcococcus bovis TaxID=3153252 RepID=UPI0038BB90CF
MTNSVILGKDLSINLSKLNRHGFITGATGSGKTVTLKVLAEQFAQQGIPVFVSDIKGDISSFIQSGEINDKVKERIDEIGLSEYQNRKYDVEFFDVFQKEGTPLRTTISEMGPILLSKLMGLNDIQEGVLNIAFKLADERKLLLVDTKDLRVILNFVNDNKTELSTIYGNISSASIGAILRSLLVIEEQGGNLFFGEPAFEITDFLKQNASGEGIINVLSSKQLYESPALYSTFLLWLLSELYENMPEVGDLDKPKIVFFFDEAHLLFDSGNKILIDKIEKIVRLIRSKGVSVFFVTQKATDIPEDILAQLGNRIQHSLRAYTPNEQKEVRAIADSFRQDGSMDIVEEILNLKTGEAIVSILDDDSKPTLAKKVLIAPPQSKMGDADKNELIRVINNSSLYEKYGESVDNESAFEILTAEKEKKALEIEQAKLEEENIKEQERLQKEQEKLLKEQEKENQRIIKEQQREETRKSNKTTMFERFTNNLIGSVGRSVGREIIRGIFGSIRKK